MRTKISLLLALVGLGIVVYAMTLTGSARTTSTVLGLIIACGGCLVFLANDRFMRTHRSFMAVVTILFVLLVVGYVIKAIG